MVLGQVGAFGHPVQLHVAALSEKGCERMRVFPTHAESLQRAVARNMKNVQRCCHVKLLLTAPYLCGIRGQFAAAVALGCSRAKDMF
jgi:hypothetical protein